MSRCVVDASIALKWFFGEGDQAEAVAASGAGLIAPKLVLTEVANAMWKKKRMGAVSVGEAIQRLMDKSAAEVRRGIFVSPAGENAGAMPRIGPGEAQGFRRTGGRKDPADRPVRLFKQSLRSARNCPPSSSGCSRWSRCLPRRSTCRSGSTTASMTASVSALPAYRAARC